MSEANPALQRELEQMRKQLLDLTTRNRLLNVPQNERARFIRAHDELSDEVVRLLVRESRPFSFQGRGEIEAEEEEEPLEEMPAESPTDLDLDERGVAAHHRDTILQTTLTDDALHRRLRSFYLDAKTAIEEQGVNTLFLALGQLKWKDDKSSDIERHAPLLLVPVELRRARASGRFKLHRMEQEPSDNLSLAAKLSEFSIRPPEFEWNEEFVPSTYFAEFAENIAHKEGWQVFPDRIVLGFFSFFKFLMYRDLDPENWPEEEKLDQHDLISALVGPGFPVSPPRFSDDANLDEIIPVERLNHVVDSDSSQALAIEEVRADANLIIQGPPGTGKSQTITNLIATAVFDGKRVLFVAEKLAALEVVQRRLKQIGLDPLVLELHSHKANKRAVLDELKRTFSLGCPKSPDRQQLLSRLGQVRQDLNSHAVKLNEPLGPSELTPIKVIGHLSLLSGQLKTADLPALDSPESWTPEERRDRERLMDGLVSRLAELGDPAVHPWKGVERTVLTRFDREEIEDSLPSVLQACEIMAEHAQALAARFELPPPANGHDLAQLQTYVAWAAAAPEVDPATIAYPRWQEEFAPLADMIETGRELVALRAASQERFVESAWGIEISRTRQHIAAHGGSLLRIFNSDYRRAMADLRGILQAPKPPSDLAERVQWMDDLILARKHESAITDFAAQGKQVFGFHWKGISSDWDRLAGILDWVKSVFAQKQLGISFLQTLPQLRETEDLAGAEAESAASMAHFRTSMEKLCRKLKYHVAVGLGQEDLASIDLADLQGRLQLWTRSMPELSNWVLYQHRVDQAQKMGLGAVCEKILHGEIAGDQARVAFDLAYYRALYQSIIATYPELASFDGHSQNHLVSEFRELDHDRIELARYETLQKHHDMMPRGGGIGAMGLLRGEMNKRRGHMPIRKLLDKTGSAIQAIKPVFMMSPLSIAQFLKAGGTRFDLVVFDEASQVNPLDALGAIARGKQVVVVGDDMQLPPTKFFARMVSEGEEEDEDEDNEMVASAKDQESILGLAATKGISAKMLRWHYRSQHQSLIEVSNHEFYGNNLFIIPSAHSGDPYMGLKFQLVENGVFDRGKTYQNVTEARQVAAAVIQHAIERPQDSLGVAAFSVKQRDAIIDELELLRKTHTEGDRFFDQHPFEPFFVKNLENVQGDERDVIFISVGYAKDTRGFFAMNFGPLNRDGGERRLNVLISRSKKRCVVFSSIQAEDIDLARTNARGVVALKTFLKFAETGVLGIPDPQTDRGMDSPFEESVKRNLEAEGYVVHPQVGSSGFFVDLAVINPDRPGQYILGVECDGATYHSARSARERDRQRQAVLEHHGWTIHRIWSTDWFRNPQQELAKTKAAIEAARARSGGPPPPPPKDRESSPPVIDREEEVEIEDYEHPKGAPYVETELRVNPAWAIHELEPAELAEYIMQVVDCEAPVHREEITVRIRQAWQLKRTGRKIQDAILNAIGLLSRQKKIRRAQNFVWGPKTKVTVRDRSAVDSEGLRKPERIAAEEYQLAIHQLLEANHGVAAKEVSVGVARLLGFRSTSAKLRAQVDLQVKRMLRQGKIVPDGEFLNPGS